MFIIAATELSRFIKYVTAFTENIFATFIGTAWRSDDTCLRSRHSPKTYPWIGDARFTSMTAFRA